MADRSEALVVGHRGDLGQVLARRRHLIALVVFSVLLAAMAYIALAPRLYLARAIVQVENEKQQFHLAPDRMPPVDTVAVDAEVEIVRSRLVLEPVIRALGFELRLLRAPTGSRVRFYDVAVEDVLSQDTKRLNPRYTIVFAEKGEYEVRDQDGHLLGSGQIGRPFEGRGVGWILEARKVEPGDSIRVEKLSFHSALEALRKQLVVYEMGKQTNLILIGIELPDPQLAKDTIERVTQAYLAQNLQRKSQEASQTFTLIEQQLRVVQNNMEAGERELNDVRSSKGIFALSQEAKRIVDQIAKIELARAELQLKQRRVGQAAAILTGAARDADYLLAQASIEDELVTKLAQELSQRLIEMQALRRDYTDQHPRVTAAMVQVEALKSKIKAAVDNANRMLKAQLRTSQVLLDQYEAQLKALPQAERELASLTRKSEVNGELYSFLLKKHEEARIAKASIVGNVRIIETAALPERPSSPKAGPTLALALLAGLLLGIGLALFSEYVDDTLPPGADIERLLGLNVYGEIPALSRVPEEALVEAYRVLATNVRFAAAHAGAKRILITSAEPAEGKTTVAAELARTLAGRGSRVLLVDGDLRRPSLHARFGVAQAPGLTDHLLMEKPWYDLLRRVGRPCLDLLPVGTPSQNRELLDSQAFTKLAAEATQRYDYVVLDSPPVLAFTDAAVASRSTDAVLLVIAAGYSRLPAVQRAIDRLRQVQAPLRGAIVTRAAALVDAAYYASTRERPGLWGRTVQRLWHLFLRAQA